MLTKLDAIASLLDQGASDSALRLLRNCWEPEMPACDRIPTYCMWTRALCETGDFDAALTLACRAAQEFPREPDILIALGNVYDIHGELEDAREAFAVAVDIEPQGILQRYNLGAILERLDEEGEAEACYRQSIAAQQDGFVMSEPYMALGALLRRAGRIDEAEVLYGEFLEEDPLHVDALVEHGICLSDLDQLDAAMEQFDAALSLDPEHPGAWYNRAITLYRNEDLPAAIEAMHRSLRAEPDNPLTLAVLGTWTVHQGKSGGVSLLHQGLDCLIELNEAENIGVAYASLVVEEIFECLWQYDHMDQAREVARVAGQRDWITPHILDALNRADYGTSDEGLRFRIKAQARGGDDHPPHWPADACGYTTDLTVMARTEEEAREIALAWLKSLEPATATFDVCVDCSDQLAAASPERDACVCGVLRIDSLKSYLRS